MTQSLTDLFSTYYLDSTTITYSFDFDSQYDYSLWGDGHTNAQIVSGGKPYENLVDADAYPKAVR